MPDIMIQCPVYRVTIPTGLSTETVLFETLPNVSTPLHCPACHRIHRWSPKDAWVFARTRGAAYLLAANSN